MRHYKRIINVGTKIQNLFTLIKIIQNNQSQMLRIKSIMHLLYERIILEEFHMYPCIIRIHSDKPLTKYLTNKRLILVNLLHLISNVNLFLR